MHRASSGLGSESSESGAESAAEALMAELM